MRHLLFLTLGSINEEQSFVFYIPAAAVLIWDQYEKIFKCYALLGRWEQRYFWSGPRHLPSLLYEFHSLWARAYVRESCSEDAGLRQFCRVLTMLHSECILVRKIRMLLSTSQVMVKIKQQHSGGRLPEFCKQWVPIRTICRITIPLTTSVKFLHTNNVLFQIHFPPKSNTKIS